MYVYPFPNLSLPLLQFISIDSSFLWIHIERDLPVGSVKALEQTTKIFIQAKDGSAGDAFGAEEPDGGNRLHLLNQLLP